MPRYTEEEKRKAGETVDERGGSVARDAQAGVSNAPDAVPMVKRAGRFAREEGRQAPESLRPGVEGARSRSCGRA